MPDPDFVANPNRVSSVLKRESDHEAQRERARMAEEAAEARAMGETPPLPLAGSTDDPAASQKVFDEPQTEAPPTDPGAGEVPAE